MTIECGQGNLITVEADALVNSVNTEGVMGKGLALQFKKAFSEVFADYVRACKARAVTIGFRLATLVLRSQRARRILQRVACST